MSFDKYIQSGNHHQTQDIKEFHSLHNFPDAPPPPSDPGNH